MTKAPARRVEEPRRENAPGKVIHVDTVGSLRPSRSGEPRVPAHAWITIAGTTLAAQCSGASADDHRDHIVAWTLNVAVLIGMVVIAVTLGRLMIVFGSWMARAARGEVTTRTTSTQTDLLTIYVTAYGQKWHDHRHCSSVLSSSTVSERACCNICSGNNMRMRGD